MALTESQKRANQRYRDKVYDRLAVMIKKGKREEYKNAANVRGMSLAGLVQSSVEEYIENHPVEEVPKEE